LRAAATAWPRCPCQLMKMSIFSMCPNCSGVLWVCSSRRRT
jgi:hypothetical protein